ncbi:MAG: hypothetical protein EA358_10155 [Flavobacteriales bacterium]|nr:MAG: hypothetical protein EA358_10155 [Flavobacteriales bacterium]
MEKESVNQKLDLVHEMISMARNRVTETGFHFLLWGVLVMMASISQYLMLRAGMGNETNLVWLGISIIGVPVGVIYEKRRSAKEGASSSFDRIYSQLWLGFGLALFLTIFVSIMHKVNPTPFILLLVGLATFVSGAIIRFVPLVAGAFVFWLAAGLSPLFDGVDYLLIYAAVIFLGYVIPGIMLAKKSKLHV